MDSSWVAARPDVGKVATGADDAGGGIVQAGLEYDGEWERGWADVMAEWAGSGWEHNGVVVAVVVWDDGWVGLGSGRRGLEVSRFHLLRLLMCACMRFVDLDECRISF